MIKKEREESLLIAAELLDINGKQRKILLSPKGQRRTLKCIKKELKKCGIISDKIRKYLVSYGGNIDWRKDKKDFEYYAQKNKRLKYGRI